MMKYSAVKVGRYWMVDRINSICWYACRTEIPANASQVQQLLQMAALNRVLTKFQFRIYTAS